MRIEQQRFSKAHRDRPARPRQPSGLAVPVAVAHWRIQGLPAAPTARGRTGPSPPPPQRLDTLGSSPPSTPPTSPAAAWTTTQPACYGAS
jgi:hypothetical protein